MGKQIQTCERCGLEFYKNNDLPNVTTCSECPIIVRREPRAPNRTRGHPVYDIALELVTLRVAFEMLEPLLNMGRHQEVDEVYKDTQKALKLLQEVEAPARDTSFRLNKKGQQ